VKWSYRKLTLWWLWWVVVFLSIAWTVFYIDTVTKDSSAVWSDRLILFSGLSVVTFRLSNWRNGCKERIRVEELCCRIHSRFGEIFLRTPPSAAAQERESSLRVLPTGHQVLLVESSDQIGTYVLIVESLEEHIGPVDHIDHERLHLLIAETREF
jgi:hypothetical protein